MRLARLLAAVSGLLVLASANAAPVRYDYSGTCTENCGAIGVASGSTVTGFMIAGDGFSSDGVLRGSELIDFGFTFGSVSITDATHTAFGLLALNADLSIDYAAAAGGITFQSFSSGASTGNIGGAAGWTARSGWWVAGGPGRYAAQVPEPAMLALLGVGLLGLGLSRRRGR